MDEALKRLVWQRAKRQCEFCQLSQELVYAPFQIDHVIAVQHGGPTRAGNLALACLDCNLRKGPNLAGIDPVRRKITPLFNTRRHKWQRHFC